MRFSLLGPLTVRHGRQLVHIRSARQRAVLAALLLKAGSVVAVEELTEVLWGSAPPPTARVTLQNYVKRLREALADTGKTVIATQPGGYLIRLAPGELDVYVFDNHVSAATSAALDGRWADAGSRARAALALWRGEPLADVGSERLTARAVPRLVELRLRAIETRIEADLHEGKHAEVIAELWSLTDTHPLREHLHAQLMLALYCDGRQGEALEVYQRARNLLIDQLGTEPGPELSELHQRILAGDHALITLTHAGVADDRVHVPRELPSPVPHFTGREAELAALTELLGQLDVQTTGSEHNHAAVVIASIGGMAGVGKTALALQWAHQVADNFADGQIYVDLRGYGPDQPLTAGDALTGFLRALGVPDRDIPPALDQRAARFRSLLAGRRMLLILDNAAEADQVRPLLPGTASCLVVVTSRHSLAGLIARHGANRFDLDPLPLDDAIALLAELIGVRATADIDAATTMAAQCSRLPLALRLAAERVINRPAAALADLVRELADQRQRLDLLDADGDQRTSVRTVFSWSYRQLDQAAARVFRLLALHPGADFDARAAAALADLALARANQLLDRLARCHLIQHSAAGRYGMHDLLRVYGSELTSEQDSEQDRHRAVTGLLDHYLYSAAAAMDVLYPAERLRRPQVGEPDPAPVRPADQGQARAWLDSERATLVAITSYASSNGWLRHAVDLGAVIFRYLDVGCYYSEALTVHTCARQAAILLGDRAAEANALNDLGSVDLRRGRYSQAVASYSRAAVLFARTGDQARQAAVLGNLGAIAYQQGRHREAVRSTRQALALFVACRDQVGEAHCLSILGGIAVTEGDYFTADVYLEQAIELFRQAGFSLGEIYALSHLGYACTLQGQHERATGYLYRALRLCEETGDPSGKAQVLANCGLNDLAQGHHDRAGGRLQRALSLFSRIGDQSGQIQAHNGLGERALAAGRPYQARAHHMTALELATGVGFPAEQARAHNGLAHASQATGQPSQARQHWQQALTLYVKLNAPQVDEISAMLSFNSETVSLSSGARGAFQAPTGRAARRPERAPRRIPAG